MITATLPKGKEMDVETKLCKPDFGDKNPRMLETADLELLMLDISTNGIRDRVHVQKMKTPDGTVYYIVLRGNRRVTCAQTLHAQDKDKFIKIPAVVYEGLTEGQADDIRLDHGNVKGLTEYEIYRFVRSKYNDGQTEGEIITNNAGLFMSLMNEGTRRGIMETLHKITTGTFSTDYERRTAYADRVKKAFHGRFQQFQRIWECPVIVEEAYKARCFGEEGAIAFTNGEAAELVKAHKADIAVSVDREIKAKQEGKEVPRGVNRMEPGEQFLAAWEGLKKGADISTGTKMLNKEEINKKVRTYTFEGFRGVLELVLGETVPGLIDYDEYLTGLVKAGTIKPFVKK